MEYSKEDLMEAKKQQARREAGCQQARRRRQAVQHGRRRLRSHRRDDDVGRGGRDDGLPAQADRLIRHESGRSPSLVRAGASARTTLAISG